MVQITIDVSQTLVDAFPDAVDAYNIRNGTEFTVVGMVEKIAKQFAIEEILRKRVDEGKATGEAEVEGL